LLGAMESAGRDLAHEYLRAAKRDSGLGTPATRAATIETLIRRTFVTRDGKHLIPTELGLGLIEALPVASLASPELTGTWEARLSRVARGEETRAAFMADISRYVGDVVTAIRGGGGGARAAAPAPRVPAPAPRVPAPAPRVPAPAPRVPAPVPRVPAPRKKTGAAVGAERVALLCPRCREGKLVAGNRGWGCSRWREGCAFVIWFEVGGRRISDAELGDLVSKGGTRRRKWPAADGAAITGRLTLDLEAPRELGAARLDTGVARAARRIVSSRAATTGKKPGRRPFHGQP